MYYDIEKIGARVAKLRKNRGMKQEELANELDLKILMGVLQNI